MAQAHNVESVGLDLVYVAKLRIVGNGVADIGIFHVAVGACKLHGASVDFKALGFGDFDVADADSSLFAVNELAALTHLGFQQVERR